MGLGVGSGTGVGLGTGVGSVVIGVGSVVIDGGVGEGGLGTSPTISREWVNDIRERRLHHGFMKL